MTFVVLLKTRDGHILEIDIEASHELEAYQLAEEEAKGRNPPWYVSSVKEKCSDDYT